MNRRDALKSLLAAQAAFLAALGIHRRAGFVDVDRWWREFGLGHAVYLDGVDATSGTRWFNDETGELNRLRLDAEGYPFIEGNEIAHETVRGYIQVRRLPVPAKKVFLGRPELFT